MLFSGFLSNWIHSCHPQVLSSNGSPPKSRQGRQRPKTVWKHPLQNIANSFHRFLGLLNTFLASIWLLNQCRPSWWPNAVIKMIFWPLAASDSRNVHLWFLNMKIPHKCGWLAKEWSQYFKMSPPPATLVGYHTWWSRQTLKREGKENAPWHQDTSTRVKRLP